MKTITRPEVYVREHPVISHLFEVASNVDFPHTDKDIRSYTLEPIFKALQSLTKDVVLQEEHDSWLGDTVTNALVFNGYKRIIDRLFSVTKANAPVHQEILLQSPVIPDDCKDTLEHYRSLYVFDNTMRLQGKGQRFNSAYARLPKYVAVDKSFNPPVGFMEILSKWYDEVGTNLIAHGQWSNPLKRQNVLNHLKKFCIRWVTLEVAQEAGVRINRQDLLDRLEIDEDPKIKQISGSTITGIYRGNGEVLKTILKNKDDCSLFPEPLNITNTKDVLHALLEYAIEQGVVNVD